MAKKCQLQFSYGAYFLVVPSNWQVSKIATPYNGHSWDKILAFVHREVSCLQRLFSVTVIIHLIMIVVESRVAF